MNTIRINLTGFIREEFRHRLEVAPQFDGLDGFINLGPEVSDSDSTFVEISIGESNSDRLKLAAALDEFLDLLWYSYYSEANQGDWWCRPPHFDEDIDRPIVDQFKEVIQTLRSDHPVLNQILRGFLK